MDTFLKVLGALAGLFLIGLLTAFPEMWAINWLFSGAFLASIFGIAKLTFWKVYVLNLVTMALFKSAK